MTPRERLGAAASGAATDRKPVIYWPVGCPESDASVGSPGRPDQITLATIVNPFGQALGAGIGVADLLRADPALGLEALDSLVDNARRHIANAFAAGADGILYLLYGARSRHTTPMEYGGHYLEGDRQLLSECADASFNMIFVVGEEDAYLDFVSDLPAKAFGWDCQQTRVSVSEMRKMRAGALAANSLEADIELRFGASAPVHDFEMELQKTHAL